MPQSIPVSATSPSLAPALRAWAPLRFAAGNPGLVLGATLVLALLCGGLFAPVLAPHDPEAQNLALRLAAPSPDFLLGTDSLGRCVASRILYGIRPTLGLALAVSLGVALIGLAVGLACTVSPLLDGLFMRLTDGFFAFPSLVLSLVIIAVAGQSLWGLSLALILPGWPKYARVARTVALSAAAGGFVEATRALGAGRLYILRRCLIPQVLPHIGTMLTVGVGGKIVAIAGLGVLGLGLPPPAPEWGGMLVKGLPLLAVAPHMALTAGAAIVLASLAFTLAGEGLQHLLDPITALAGAPAP